MVRHNANISHDKLVWSGHDSSSLFCCDSFLLFLGLAVLKTANSGHLVVPVAAVLFHELGLCCNRESRGCFSLQGRLRSRNLINLIEPGG